MFKVHQSPRFLDELSITISYFSGQDLSGNISKEGEDSLVSLHQSAHQKKEDITTALFSKLQTDLYDINILLPEKGLWNDEDLVYYEGLESDLVRIDSFSKQAVTFFSLSALTSLEESCFTTMNNCLDTALQILKAHTDTPNELSGCFVLHSNSIIRCCIDIMATQIMCEYQKIGSDSDEENFGPLVAQTKRVCDFCEAVVSDSEGKTFQISFTIITRFICLKTLNSLFHMITANRFERFSSIQRSPTLAYQEQAFLILADAMKIGCFELPRHQDGALHISINAAYDFQEEFQAVFQSLHALVRYEVIDTRFAAPTFALSFIAEEQDNYLWQFHKSHKMTNINDDFVSLGLFGKCLATSGELFATSNIEMFPELLMNLAALPIEKEIKLNLVGDRLDSTFTLFLSTIEYVNDSLLNLGYRFLFKATNSRSFSC